MEHSAPNDAKALWDSVRVLVACNDFHGSVLSPHVDSVSQFMFEAADLIASGKIVPFKIASYMTDYARSHIAWVATRPENAFTHVFMYDADMTFTLDDITQLLSRDVDIVSGTYFMRVINKGVGGVLTDFPCVATIGDDHITRDAIRTASERNELIRCSGVGGGSLLIKTDVLRRVGQPTFEFDWWIGGDRTFFQGEDTVFCTKAIRAGYEIFMDPDVRPQHFALVRVGFDICDNNNRHLYTPQT